MKIRDNKWSLAALCIALFTPIALHDQQTYAFELTIIGPETRPEIGGKEVDWIDGDYLLTSDRLVAVIARPNSIRDANMTTRGVGAALIDLTRRDIQSDQLTVIYPGGGRFKFHDDAGTKIRAIENGARIQFQSSASVAKNDTKCTVEYRLRDGQNYVEMTVTIDGPGAGKLRAYDGIRADRTFKFDRFGETNVAFCEDEYFRQTYGFVPSQGTRQPRWNSNRPKQLIYVDAATVAADGNRIAWTVKIYPASSSVDLWGMINGGNPQTISISGAVGDQPRMQMTLLKEVGSLKEGATWRVGPNGKSVVHLPAGKYPVRAEAIGHVSTEATLRVSDGPGVHKIALGAATVVAAKITDGGGRPVACKVSFYGAENDEGQMTKSPNFGLDSQYGSVGNTVYSTDGEFVRSIPPGDYDVVISHGPEYDAVFETVQIPKGKRTLIEGSLKRVVDTTGWVSAELHSHSSPSGDNTSDQLGRVENLVCEHLEFAPCTEHQRIESYDDQLIKLNATQQMKTCTGMELTGSLLPINHQNAFPLKWKPFAQDGGGPRISGNPETQIARLAMWDDGAKKVVQTNHPNMRQMVFDRDLDGKADGGFSGMLDFMDVIEVHPPADIFKTDDDFKNQRARDRSRIQPWMKLIKSGRRIPGVVNTDAHYNWHGSGWLRNWVRSDSDVPAEISVDNMIDSLEQGRIIMSTGPFMNVQLHHDGLDKPAQIGDSVQVTGAAELAVKVQCANWLDVNIVEVFVDGESVPELKRTRADHPDAFGDGVVKFDQRLPMQLKPGTFIIVAAIGKNLQLGRVMGESFGRRAPVVVSNPIYIER